jgi:ABC-2 type transport system ATP-binding protein
MKHAVQNVQLAISTQRLRKVFGDKVAVRGLSLEVRRGEAFGFLGPNGAGKSTSIKMLLGLIQPTHGDAEVLGRPIGYRGIRARIGFLPEHFRFYDWLTSSELLQVHGRLYGMAAAELRQRIPQLLELVGLSGHSSSQLRAFSKGMLQRVGLAQALLPSPDLIFLDEPTSGLDPIGRRLVRDIIKAERERGATVFLNSHLLSEVEITCDRVAFIKAGEVIEIRDVKSFDQDRNCVFVRAANLTEETVAGLRAWASHVERNGAGLQLRMHSPDLAPQVLRYLVERGTDVFEFIPQRLSLEDRFLEIVGSDQGL